ncbi:hypothetical protein SGGMMB4_00776 [Sodalis glossinidius str. 'morsitans']|uniref:Uncharacterized protein n=1 Tax=Sodalis glossinidius (strain morsitans) TaxID=343509 RepID=A0A193QFQ3_SODGM|nr:hypothetical protein SGGMMB4_00776 [Sodalis glossinidius str. 'morsitans']
MCVEPVDEHRIFDERIQVAKEKIEACITRWSGGADAKLMALVNRAFNVNKQGYIDINSVLSLRDLDITMKTSKRLCVP